MKAMPIPDPFERKPLLSAGEFVAWHSRDVTDLPVHSAEPVVILIHGMANSSVVWYPVLRSWDLENKLLAVDIPGHGRSTSNSIRLRVSSVAGILEAFIRRYVTGPIVLVGHSLGSIISLEIARQAPDRVIGCLLLSGPPTRVAETYAHPFRMLVRDPRGALQLAQIVGADVLQVGPILRWVSGHKKVQGDAAFDYALHSLGTGRAAATALGGFGIDYRARYRSLRVPMRALIGSEDHSISAEEVAGYLPELEVRSLPGIGHMPMTEDPPLTAMEIAKAIADWKG